MSGLRSAVARLLGAALVAAGLAVVVAPAPAAHAAACPRGTGVTVVVNSDVRCDPTAGGYARGHFTGVGHVFEDARRFPGFVCRINGYPGPADDKCVDASPATAYWSLWWSDGKGGPWVYSQLGVNSLTVPEGGWVAFRWNVGGGKVEPPVRPVTAGGSSGGSGSGGSGASSGSSGGGSGSTSGGGPASTEQKAEKKTAEKKAEKKKAAEKKRNAEQKAAEEKKAEEQAEREATERAEVAAAELAAQREEASSGSLGWIATVAVLLGLGAVGGFLAWRRRSGMSP